MHIPLCLKKISHKRFCCNKKISYQGVFVSLSKTLLSLFVLAGGGGIAYYFLNHPNSNQLTLSSTETAPYITTSQLLQSNHKKSSSQIVEKESFSTGNLAEIDKKARQLIAEADAYIAKEHLDTADLPNNSAHQQEQLRQIETLLAEAENELASIH